MAKIKSKFGYADSCRIFASGGGPSAASKATGYTRKTCGNWKKEWERKGGVVVVSSKEELMIEVVEEKELINSKKTTTENNEEAKSVKYKVMAVSKADKLMDAMLDRTLKLIPKEKSLKNLTILFKEIAPYLIKKLESGNGDGDVAIEDYYNALMQKIQKKKHKINNNGQSKDIIDIGHQEISSTGSDK